MLSEFLRPRRDADGTYAFSLPLGKDGHLPMIALEDVGFYGRWLFDHPEESSGLDLKVVTDLVSGEMLAETFTKVSVDESSDSFSHLTWWVNQVTGKPARFNDVTLEDFFAGLPFDVARPLAPEDPSGLTWKQNFTGWWTNWRNNTVKRDFDILDKIRPQRLTLETWMTKVGYDGEVRPVLKGWRGTSDGLEKGA